MSLRRIALCILIAGTTAFGAGVSHAASVAIEINAAPPPPRVVVVPPPRVGYVWVPGYWRWNGHRHLWVNGHWVRERRGWHWVPAQWVEAGPRWRFVPGLRGDPPASRASRATLSPGYKSRALGTPR